MGWFALYEDNVIEWDIRLRCQQPSLPIGQHYKVALSDHSRLMPVYTHVNFIVLPLYQAAGTMTQYIIQSD